MVESQLGELFHSRDRERIPIEVRNAFTLEQYRADEGIAHVRAV